jgi:hypothetical protein
MDELTDRIGEVPVAGQLAEFGIVCSSTRKPMVVAVMRPT